tara:strand:+ start:78 stop:464 length:387 start_codon:yes stop_codon:yes gene_type:complete
MNNMASYVYVIQNGDLYHIGCTINLDKTRNDLRPGELIASLKTDNAEFVFKKLRKNFVNNRIPGSDYYRLGQSQIKECRILLEEDGSANYYQPFLRGGRLFLFFILSWFLITYLIVEFGINPIFNRLN